VQRRFNSIKFGSIFAMAFQLHFSLFYFHGLQIPSRPGPPHYRGFTITLRHTTLGRNPLDERSARCTGLHLSTNNTHKRQTFMSLAGFETKVPANERPQTQALGRAATRIGYVLAITLTTKQHCKNRTFGSLGVLMHKERRILLQPTP